MSKLKVRGKVVYISYTDRWGLRHRESLGIQVDDKGRIPQSAKKLQDKIDAEEAFGIRNYPQPLEKILLSKMLEEYDNYIGSTRKDGTKYLYKLAVNTMISKIGDTPIQSIDEEKFIEFREWIIKKQGVQNASRCIRSLSPIFGYAVHKGYIQKSPISKYTRVNAPPVKPVVFTDEELKNMFKYLNKEYPEASKQLRFLLYTGFRLNESCTIKAEDIDFKRRIIWHFDDKMDEYVSFPMDDDLYKLLKSLPKREDGFLFHYRSKHSLDHIMRKVKAEMKKKGKQFNPALRIHSLKKNYVRTLIEAGLPEMDVHKLAHHKSVQTTHKYYATFDIDRLRESLKKSRNKVA